MVKLHAAIAAVSIALVSGCTESSGEPVPEPTPEFSVTPAAWLDYEREKLTPADCPHLAAGAAQELLAIQSQPWVFDVLRDVSKKDEVAYAQCSFSDPGNLDNQVVFQMNRIENRVVQPYRTPLLLVVMERLKTDSPLNERYPGFGKITTVGKRGGQTAMWACGNQWLSVSVQQGATAQKDQAPLLWKHIEPSIQRQCGTAEKPAVPLAVDDDLPNAKKLARPDAVADFVRRKNLDLPNTESASAESQEHTPNSSGKPTSSGHVESIERCDMYSVTDAVRAFGLEGRKYQARGSRSSRRMFLGRRGDCDAKIYREDGSDAVIVGGASFFQYTTNRSFGDRSAEAYASFHIHPTTNGPYKGKYRGFGVLGKNDTFTSPQVTWLCGGYVVRVTFSRTWVDERIEKPDMWALAEPSIRRVCGRPDEPMTPPLGWDLRRVDYTKLLMEDWKIGSGAQLFDPPEKKRYLLPGARATGEG